MKTLTTPFSFFVEGEPIPKQSFRISSKGNYALGPTKAWEELVGWTARAKLNAIPTWAGEKIKGPMSIFLDFYLSTKRIKDGDNLEKGVMDGIKNVIIEDDSVWNVRSMVKNYHHVKDSPDGKAGVMVTISAWHPPF